MSLDSRPRNYDRHSWCGRESRNSRKRDLSLPKCTKTVFPDTFVAGTRAFNTTEMPEEMHAELINLALEMRGWNPREL